MARDRDPFGLALNRVRTALRDGVIAPGQPLLAAELATGLKISATPVREALSRLAGEGLLEDRRGRGFYALRPGAAEIEEFYALHGAYIGLALDLGGSAHPQAPSPGLLAIDDPEAFRGRTEQLWASFIQRTGGGVLDRAFQRLTDQLALIRLIEPLVLDKLEDELGALVVAAASSTSTLREAVTRYDDRRRSAARMLSSKLRETPNAL